MPEAHQKDADPVFVLKVPGGTVEGRDEAEKWAQDALEDAVKRLSSDPLFGQFMALLRCRTALKEIADKRRNSVDFERVEPLSNDAAIAMLREV